MTPTSGGAPHANRTDNLAHHRRRAPAFARELDFLEVREYLHRRCLRARLVLQVEAFEGVGGCCGDWLRGVAGSRQRRRARRGIM
jgi:hypothetical protein